jgi:hypothetical protein
VFQRELCNDLPNVTVRRMLRKRLHLKQYKLSIVEGAVKLFLKHPVKLGCKTFWRWCIRLFPSSGILNNVLFSSYLEFKTMNEVHKTPWFWAALIIICMLTSGAIWHQEPILFENRYRSHILEIGLVSKLSNSWPLFFDSVSTRFKNTERTWMSFCFSMFW